MPALPVIGAVATVGGSFLGRRSANQAADRASDAQVYTAELGINETSRQFDAIQELLSPFVGAGTSGINAMMDLAGLNGTEAEQAAIQGIENSPEFTGLVESGERSILQNASATGGLRGGNTQAALAQFRPEMLRRTIEDRYNRLSGISQLGQASAAGVASAGLESTSNITRLLGDQGAARAGAHIARGQNDREFFGDLGSLIGTIAGGF